MEGDKLFMPHIGKWLRVSLPVNDVFEGDDELTVTMYPLEIRTLWLEFEKKRWMEHLETIRKNDLLTAEGKIKKGSAYEIHLVDCEVLDR